MIIKPYESKYRLAAKHAKVMREKRAQENYKSSSQLLEEYNRNAGQFYSDDNETFIFPNQARFRIDNYLPIWFSATDKIRLFKMLDFDFVRYLQEEKVFEVKPQFGVNVFLKMTYLSDDTMLVQRVEIQSDIL